MPDKNEFNEIENANVFPDDNAGALAPAKEINMAASFGDIAEDMFSTVDTTTPDGKMKILSMMGEPDARIKEEVNKEITIKDIYCEVVKLPNDRKGGRLEDCPRCIILDNKGKTHACTSFGVFNMLRRIFFVMEGNIAGVKVVVTQTAGKNNNTILSLKVVG